LRTGRSADLAGIRWERGFTVPGGDVIAPEPRIMRARADQLFASLRADVLGWLAAAPPPGVDPVETQARLATIAAELARLIAEVGALDAAFEYDPEPRLVTDGSGAVRSANRAACAFFGVLADQLVGKPLAVFVDGDRGGFRTTITQAMQSSPFDPPRTWDGAIRRRGAEATPAACLVRRLPDERGRLLWVFHAKSDAAAPSRTSRDTADWFAVQEAERRRIALALHDDVGSSLTGIGLELAAAQRSGPEALERAAATIGTEIQTVLDRLRAVALDLRPSMLDQGLISALTWYCDRLASEGFDVSLQHDALDRRFPAEIELAAFRVVQEALTNVRRHAGVTHAEARVWTGGDVLGVQVADRGCGFTPGPTASTGLSGMKERCQALGGTLIIDAAPGAGTTVTAEFPA
jgi:PAS domain S-box-containing protein